MRAGKGRICSDMRIFLWETYSLDAYLHKYANYPVNLSCLGRVESQDIVEKSQGVVKILRRLVEIILDVFQTIP